MSLPEDERHCGEQGYPYENEQEEALCWAVLYKQEEKVGPVEKEKEGNDGEERGAFLETSCIKS